MKVGLSFSRCLRDIVEARVLLQDVLVIIARTNFNPHDDKQWEQIWNGYRYGGASNAEWSGAEPNLSDEDANAMYRNMAIQLYDNGQLHQPRQFGSHPRGMPYYWLECIVPDNEQTPAVKTAWDQYKLISGLSSKPVVFHDDF
jgi:hypothetical protein